MKVVFVVAFCVAVIAAFEQQDQVTPLDEVGRDISLPSKWMDLGEAIGETPLAGGGVRTTEASLNTTKAAVNQAAEAETIADSTEKEAEEQNNEIQKMKEKVTEKKEAAEAADQDLKSKAVSAENQEAADKKAEKDSEAKASQAKKSLEAAKAMAAKDGIAVSSANGKVQAAVQKTAEELKAVKEATDKRDNAKLEMDDMEQKFKSAERVFHQRQHKLELLTGMARKGETFEEYLERKDKQKKFAQEGARQALDEAQRAYDAAEDEEATAKAAVMASKEETRHLEKEESQAKEKAEALEKALAEAIKAGTATQEMVEEAKRARQEATKAAMKLSQSRDNLERLEDKATAALEKKNTLKKKTSALEKLHGAEMQLVQQLKDKAEATKQRLREAKKVARKNELARLRAAKDAEAYTKELQEAESDLSLSKADKVTTDQKLAEAKTKLEKYKATHLTLAHDVHEASKISIPTGTDVPEAKIILEKKEAKLTEFTNKLMSEIKDQKRTLTQQSILEKRDLELGHKVDNEQAVVDKDKKVSESANKELADKTDAEDKATEEVSKESKEVKAEEANAATAEGTQAQVDAKLKADEKALDKANQKTKEMKAEANKETLEMNDELNRLENAKDATTAAKLHATTIPTVADITAASAPASIGTGKFRTEASQNATVTAPPTEEFDTFDVRKYMDLLNA